MHRKIEAFQVILQIASITSILMLLNSKILLKSQQVTFLDY
jgi:hypothetical protein